MGEEQSQNPAEQASQRALSEVFACLQRGESFVLEAGAGAGKTYSLVKALQFLIARDHLKLPKYHQKIACITFTNVAKQEIMKRIDGSPLIHCDTVHAFCWSLISGLQKQIRVVLSQMTQWQERLESAGGLGDRMVQYTLGYRDIEGDRVSIHHDDVLPLTIALMENARFRRIMTDKYPVILIDEYQDTNEGWMKAIERHFLGQPDSPQFGFFGDEWQKIYGNGCGKIESPHVVRIGKEANFRSVSTIVNYLNRMRRGLPQFAKNADDIGSVQVFHTNDWVGVRQTGSHWGGDLPPENAHAALAAVQHRLLHEGWDLSARSTKILLLTHRGLANEQGYSSLPNLFRYSEAFTSKEDEHIAYFVDKLEPACDAFAAKRYGRMFEVLGGRFPAFSRHSDKEKWSAAMERLIALRNSVTVKDVIRYLRETRLPRLPDAVEDRERALERFDKDSGEEMPRNLCELEALHAVPYQEIIALARYHAGYSPFETKHGVKGAEFENVIVVVGRGWNQYNFKEMLELAQTPGHIPPKKLAFFERNRNLFYVSCSRPKRRLAILFTQELSNTAIRTLEDWFGAEAIEPLAI